MPDDILTLIDRIITHQAKSDALTCGYCQSLLNPRYNVSLDFCSQGCQEDWGIVRTDGYARDTGKGFLEDENWHHAINTGMIDWRSSQICVPATNEEVYRYMQRWITEALNS